MLDGYQLQLFTSSMAAPVQTTLLALLLALKNLEDSLEEDQQEALADVVQQLDNHLDDWEFIEADLMAAIALNASLEQLYREAKTKLDAVDGNIPSDLLPTEAELKQALPAARQREKRPYKPSQADNEKSDAILNTSIGILTTPDPANTTKKLSSLDRLWQFLNPHK
jgi:hypothetical protein